MARDRDDDSCMLPAGHDAAQALYRITDATCERRSLAVTSKFQRRMHRAALADGGRDCSICTRPGSGR
jgi:hypothetical protein